MTYEETLKQIKLDILEMDVTETEFITKMDVNRTYDNYGEEIITIQIQYKKIKQTHGWRRLFKKPIKPERPGRNQLTAQWPTTSAFTFDTTAAADNFTLVNAVNTTTGGTNENINFN